jgi:hypothetical protein
MKRRAIVACLASFFSVAAYAQDSSSEQRGCITSESSVIDRTADVVIGHSVTRGVSDSIPAGGLWDKTTHDCRSVWTSSKAGLEFTNRCTNVDRDGDKFFTVATGTTTSFKWSYIAGTGKYAGITGGGSGGFETVYPRTSPAVSGACWRGKGTYRLSKDN